MNYEINIASHYPHDRFALGWEYIAPDKNCSYHTFTLYLLIFTINFNYETD
jgi:hypothetical protein